MKKEKITFSLNSQSFSSFVKPLLQDRAIAFFGEQHHREPTRLESDNLAFLWENELKEALEEKADSWMLAVEILFERLPRFFAEVEWEEMKMELIRAGNMIFSHPLKIKETQNGECFQTFLQISDKTLKHCYQIGFDLFKEGNFQEACSVFDFLSFLNPFVKEFWLALGLSRKSLGNYLNALAAFSVVYILDPTPVTARIQSVECYIALHQFDDARIELKELEELISKTPDLKNCSFAVENLKEKLALTK